MRVSAIRESDKLRPEAQFFIPSPDIDGHAEVNSGGHASMSYVTGSCEQPGCHARLARAVVCYFARAGLTGEGGLPVSARPARSRKSFFMPESAKPVAAARRCLAAAGDSSLGGAGSGGGGSATTTLTDTDVALMPMAAAEARICVCIRRNRLAQAGVLARKCSRPWRRLANRTSTRSGEGRVWRSARSSASSAPARLASVAKEPHSASDLGPCAARREMAVSGRGTLLPWNSVSAAKHTLD